MLTRIAPLFALAMAWSLLGCGAGADAPTVDEITARAALSADAQLPRGQSLYPQSSLDWSACQAQTQAVDFTDLKVGAQRLDLRLTPRGPVLLGFDQFEGQDAPLALIYDRQGQAIWLGDASATHDSLTMTPRGAARAEPSPDLTMQANQEVDVVLYLTSWESLLGGLAQPPAARWALTVSQDCQAPAEDMGVDLPQGEDLPQEDMQPPDMPQEDMDPPDMEPGPEDSLALLRADAALPDQDAGDGVDHESIALAQCGSWRRERAFQGEWLAHRYSLALSSAGPAQVDLSPGYTLVVTDAQGGLIFDGASALDHPQVTAEVTGARVSLRAPTGASVRLFVTSSSGFEAGLVAPPTGGAYTLSVDQSCQVQLSEAAQTLAQDARLGDASSDDQVEPARIWRTQATVTTCQSTIITEDFSSGRYNVHRWSTSLSDRGPLVLTLERSAGDWQPALLLVDDQGQVIYQGDGTGGAPGYIVEAGDSGRSTESASLTLVPQVSGPVYLYVTSWGALDSQLSQGITQQARYRLRVRQSCPPDGDPGELSTYYEGLALDGAQIPREGVANSTLENTLGVNPEPLGEVVSYQGMDFVSGRVSWFGGPSDTGVTPTETGAITGERLRELQDPEDPDEATLQARPEDYYFVAMRFSYSPQGRNFWQNARFLVLNPESGAAVVVRAVDWGPHTNTGRILDLSPQSLDDLGIITDDEALVAFAPPGTPLGPVALP